MIKGLLGLLPGKLLQRLLLPALGALAMVVVLTSCQTVSEKRMARVESVALKFRFQEGAVNKVCKVKVHLSAPTEEKYKLSFGGESGFSEPLEFIWEVSGRRCQMRMAEASGDKWKKNHEVVVKAAFCTLVQGFVVESPFSGLSLLPADVQSDEEWTKILGVQSRKPVLEIHNQELKLKATSGQNRVFTANYDDGKSFPRIRDIKMEDKNFDLILSDFEFQDFSSGLASNTFIREIQSFSISTKDESGIEPSLYSIANVNDCE